MGAYSFTGAVQYVTATNGGQYSILAFGAQGGSYRTPEYGAYQPGGKGAQIGGEFTLTPGERLGLVVGGAGTGLGGGGGSFVFTVNSDGSFTPLVVAGGGGGASYGTQPGGGGQIGRGANAGFGGRGDTSGNGGGGGGGGFFGNGSAGTDGTLYGGPNLGGGGGESAINGFAGGQGFSGRGGFGGGGGGGGNYGVDTAAGGGGGYSGGNGAASKGAGGQGGYSFNASTSRTVAIANVQSGNGSISITAVCFVAGTLILTDRGEVAIEALRVGDIAVTASGMHRPIRWIGHRTMACRGRKDVLPVRIAAGAFGEGRPSRDLLVSPAHAICVDLMGEMLIPAVRLINGTTITHEETETVSYWHVELESHDVLLAEGLPAESYLNCGNRRFFANADITDLGLLPDAKPMGELPFCRPFHEAGAVVEFVRARLDARARVLGWHLVEEPFAGLHLLADGKVIYPDLDGSTARFVLPADARNVRLVSETSVPAHVLPGSTDDRHLGLPLVGLTIDDGLTGARTIALDDARLGVGFHSTDRDDAVSWRWTDGSAVLPVALWAGCRGAIQLQVTLAGSALPRWVGPYPKADLMALKGLRQRA